jgi:hypothetical protein
LPLLLGLISSALPLDLLTAVFLDLLKALFFDLDSARSIFFGRPLWPFGLLSDFS